MFAAGDSSTVGALLEAPTVAGAAAAAAWARTALAGRRAACAAIFWATGTDGIAFLVAMGPMATLHCTA